MTEAYSAKVSELHQKYASTFPAELSFAVGPLFRNLAKLNQPETSEEERQRIYPILVREFLILTTHDEKEPDPAFVGAFTELIGVNINDFVQAYATEFGEAA